MYSSAEINRKLKIFSSVGDIVSAMKAYAGLTMRKTEGVVSNIREYERNIIAAIGDTIRLLPDELLYHGGGSGRLLVAFGSSQGLCGPYNEHIAEFVANEIDEHDTLFVIGTRLKGVIESKGIPIEISADSPVSINGINKALENAVTRIFDIYSNKNIYNFTITFTAIRKQSADIALEQVLPPDLGRAKKASSKTPPITYMEAHPMFEETLEELIYIRLYRAYMESLRSENWYRLNVLEGATDNLERHLFKLRTLKNYVRQEEITEEMLEILSSGSFYH